MLEKVEKQNSKTAEEEERNGGQDGETKWRKS